MTEEKREKGFGRREFVKGTIIGGSALALAGLDARKVKAAIPPKKWDKQVDVIVVGAGGAGLMAAIQAHMAGADVLVIQKTDDVFTSSTAISGGSFSAAGTRFQREKGIEDSPAKFYEDMLKYGRYMNDPELLKMLTENAGIVFDWLVDQGLPSVRLETTPGSGHSVLRSYRSNKNTGKDYIDTMYAIVEKRQIPIYFGTEAKRLFAEPDSGRVLGVEASKGGKKIALKARRAVVMATGGFAREVATFDRWVPAFAGAGNLVGGIGDAGDGIKMIAKNAGGLVTHLQYTATYPYGIELESRMGLVCRYWYFLPLGAILVNKVGKRFIDEQTAPTRLTATLAEQPGKVHFLVTHRTAWEETFAKYPPGGVISPSTPGSIQKEIALGRVLMKADTIRELALKTGMEPEILEKTISAYNGFVDAGKDAEFGTDAKFLKKKIEGLPLYAIKMTFATVLTLGGVSANAKCQVLDPYGTIVKGLYAAGETVGGVHGSAYLSGCAMAWAHTSGYIAGKNAAAEKQ